MRKALVIGINNYPEAELECCVNDAYAIGTILETNGDGSPNFEVITKTNIPTKAELRGLIVELFEGDAESALFYFSGHGLMKDVGGYIVTPDYVTHDEGISMNEILEYANNSDIKNKIIILDCCHSGAFGDRPSRNSNSPIILGGVSILTASRSSESAVEFDGHGIFTNLLLDALQGGASDLGGHITPGSVYSYIDKALGEWGQRPVFKTNINRFTSLRSVTRKVSLETLRRLPKYFINSNDEYDLDPSYEFTNNPDIEHEVKTPYSIPKNVDIFKELQKLASIGLIIPVDEEHMYFAAMNSKSCRLTALGFHYWRLASEKRI